MEPSIQYAKTEDGVSIAYWTMGEGEPLVLACGWGASLDPLGATRHAAPSS